MWWQRPLSEFVTLFIVINPVAVLPAFLAMVGTLAPSAQRKVALSASLISFVVLVFFAFAGRFLLEQMGIPVRAFQIAGGIVLFMVAVAMIRGETYSGAASDRDGYVALATYPLAIPKIAGPGAMLTIILLTDDDRGNLTGQMITMGMLALVMVITLIVMLAATPISRLIGTAGIGVIGRVMGMLLAALAVSIVLSALGDWLQLPQL